VESTLQCAQLYDLKKARYWGDEVGNDKYAFNESLNTCLALNIHLNYETGRYFAMVIDVVSDRTLLYYSDDPSGTIVDGQQVITCENRAVHLSYSANEKEIKEAGCDRYDLMDRMLERVRALGFEP